MKRPKLELSPVPDQVVDVLKTNKIGYLSVLSKSEELYSYPVAFHFSDLKLYFMTPVSAVKFKILKSNPTVSFIVDNGKVTTEACGAMIQGRAKIFTIGRTLVSILSIGPKMIGFTKKYPGMLSFYAHGRELPDERKLYKYRLIRIDPSKIIYWIGYAFGRYVPDAKGKQSEDQLKLSNDKPGLDIAAKLLHASDEEIPAGPSIADHDWLARIEGVVPEGLLSREERRILASYKGALVPRNSQPSAGGKVTEDEKSLLKKSRY